MKLTADSAMKIAKDLTITALENGYVPKSNDVNKAATYIADFYIKLASELSEDSSNARIHLEQ